VNEIDEAADRIYDAAGQLSAAAGRLYPTGSSSTITINGGGAVAILVGMVGVLGIVVAVACVLVVSAYRQADMVRIDSLNQQAAALKAQADLNTAYIEQFKTRLSKLEH
jgi:hypothetical protein